MFIKGGHHIIFLRSADSATIFLMAASYIEIISE